MLNPLFYGKIKDGRIKIAKISQSKFKQYLSSLEGKDIIFRIQRDKPLRTDNQNKYYWAVIIQSVADETGMEPEEVHEAFRWKFLKDQSKKIPTAISTTKLTTDEFIKYTDKCRRFAETELGLIIPPPGDIDLENIFSS